MTRPTSNPPNHGASPYSVWKVDHAAIRVPDLDAAVAWFKKALDCRLLKQVTFAGLQFAFLSMEGNDNFVFELLAGPGADKRPAYADLHESYKTAGWHHVCFRVPSVDNAIAQLKERGVTIVSEPHDVAPMRLRVAFFADPWGNLFEVTESLGGHS